MFSAFDPELKITPAQGKVFDPNTDLFLQIDSFSEVELVSQSLEDNALVRYRDRQVPVVLKGVDENYSRLAHLEDILLDGDLLLKDEINNYALLGVILATNLGVNVRFAAPLEIFVPKRNVPVNMSNPAASFTSEYAYIGGIFLVNQAIYDENYMLVPIDLVRELFAYPIEVTALEIKLKDGANVTSVQKKIRKLIGDDFEVKDRHQQQEASFKMMQIEKWVIFLILSFILLIAVFNVIGSLSMLMIDKQADVMTLRNLGANDSLISRIFLFEGWMISVLGGIFGIIAGILLCLGQQHFGWLQLGTGANFAVSAYPVIVSISDVLIVFLTVLFIGFLSVQYPVRYLSKKWLR